MKKALVLILAAAVVLASGCTSDRLPNEEFFEFTDADYSAMEEFSVTYPDWERANNTDPLNVITLTGPDGACTFYLNAPQAPMEWYEDSLKDYVRKQGWVLLAEDPISYRMPSESVTLLSRTAGMYCNDKSYFVIFTCIESVYREDLYREIVNSMSCRRDWTLPKRESRKLGLVINPVNSSARFTDYVDAYNLARNAGVQMTHDYVNWGMIEDSEGERNWMVPDYINNFIRTKGMESSVVFSIIHSSVVGELPGDLEFRGFDDPGLVSRFTDFVLDYIERYRDVIEYVEIGNEVDIYLSAHRDELPAFKSMYSQVYDSIKAEYPDLPVGTVIAYHDMRENNAMWVYHNLSDVGDFDDFTLYIYSRPGFVFNRDPAEVRQHLEEIEELTGDRDFGLEEVGWSTSYHLLGKGVDQRAAVGYFFDYLEEAPDRLQFMHWFLLHDGTPENCREQAESFLEPGSYLLEDLEFMETFSDFLCQLGLITANGVPKLAWTEFRDRAKEYTGAGSS